MYALAIWRPIGKIDMNRLERIQHKVLRRLAYLCRDMTMTTLQLLKHSVQLLLTSSIIASDVVIVYKIKSNHVKNLLPIYNPNYALRNRLPFYQDLPSSRNSEANPIFRLSRCYNDLFQNLENPLAFSLNVSKVAVLLKMLTLVYK